MVFVIPYIGLVLCCALPDSFQKESVCYVFGGIKQPHVWGGISGKGGHSCNIFEVVGYRACFLCTAYRWVLWIMGVILRDGSEEPLVKIEHVRLNEHVMT